MNKYYELSKHLKSGKWLSPMLALNKFGMSPSGYHHAVHKFFERNRDYEKLHRDVGGSSRNGGHREHKAKKK